MVVQDRPQQKEAESSSKAHQVTGSFGGGCSKNNNNLDLVGTLDEQQNSHILSPCRAERDRNVREAQNLLMRKITGPHGIAHQL